MKKKDYIIPGITVITLEAKLMQFVVSGNSEDISSNPNPDVSNDDNRSRRTYNVWEDEEEEEDY